MTPVTTRSSTPGAARMQWMDFLRGIAVLLVVVLHAASHGGAEIQAWSEINRHLTPFRMPLLMFLSGMLLHRSLAKPLPVYLWGKVAAIVWPLLVWMVIYGFFVRSGIGFPDSGIDYWLNGDYLWFLMSLTLCYFFAALFKPLLPRFPAGNVWAFLGVFAAMMVTYVYGDVSGGVIGSTFWYGSFFFLGAWAVHFVQHWVRAHWLMILPLFIAAAYFAHVGVHDRDLRVGTFEAAGISVLGIAVILWLAARLPRTAPVRFVEWVGRSSIVVYVAHFPIIIFAREHILGPLELPAGLHVVLMTLIGIAGSVLLVWLRPWTTWLYVLPRHQKVAARLLTWR